MRKQYSRATNTTVNRVKITYALPANLRNGQDTHPLPKPELPALSAEAAGPAAPAEARVFHTLDALRGIAAIGVVIFHMQQAFLPVAVPGGYLAVDLFFMMSGVVLSHAYEARFKAGMGTIDFMRARLIRLYPLYLLGTLFGIVVTLASLLGRNSQGWEVSSLVQAALLALVFLPNLSGRPTEQIFPLNIPCWSLFLEIVVNLLFVVTWPLLTSRRLVVVCLLTGAMLILSIVQAGNIDQGSTASTLAMGLARTVFGFSLGVLIARHARHAERRENNLQVLAIMAVVGIAIAGRPAGELRAVWDAVCVLAVFPLVVWFATLVDPGPRLRKLATFLGVTSYAVYVLHSPVASVLNSVSRHFVGGTGEGGGAPWSGIAVLGTLLAGCWLVDRIIDMPVRRLLNRIVPRMRTPRERP
jgi:peptidoglycan/LPS O-acetylase OafA/YrhL